jgi:hypothetical protein
MQNLEESSFTSIDINLFTHPMSYVQSPQRLANKAAREMNVREQFLHPPEDLRETL